MTKGGRGPENRKGKRILDNFMAADNGGGNRRTNHRNRPTNHSKTARTHVVIGDDKFASGIIFICSEKGKSECLHSRVLDLHSWDIDVVRKIGPATKIFLYEFDKGLLHGIYVATFRGDALRTKVAAQVSFEIAKECLPLSAEKFKRVVLGSDISNKGGVLSYGQVQRLCSLFEPVYSGLELPKEYYFGPTPYQPDHDTRRHYEPFDPSMLDADNLMNYIEWFTDALGEAFTMC